MDKVRLLNQKTLARFLGVDRTTVYRWRENELWGGKPLGPQPIQVGKRFYYSYAVVLSWLESNTYRATLAGAGKVSIEASASRSFSASAGSVPAQIAP